MAQYLRVYKQTALMLIKEFEKNGVLKEFTGKKRWKEYLFSDYVALIKKGTES